jgi:Amt family ammonium transporter
LPLSRRLNVQNDDAFLGGMIDWAGSCAVHMTGGIIAFVGAMIVGPRRGRFDSVGKPVPMPGSNAALQVRNEPT